MSCYVLGGLPFVLGVALEVLDPSYMHLLFGTGTGHLLLLAAAILLGAGITSMWVLTRNALR